MIMNRKFIKLFLLSCISLSFGTAARCRRCKNSVGTNTRSDPNTRSDL